MSESEIMRPVTVYKLTWGAGGHVPETVRYFGPTDGTDVAVRFAERVVALDGNPSIGGAYVHLQRLPDSIYPKGMCLLAWTKTSNERATRDGYPTEHEAVVAALGPGRPVPPHGSGPASYVQKV